MLGPKPFSRTIPVPLTESESGRPLTKGMKAVFFVGSILVAAAGIQLFIFTESTDKWFAWTISAPMSAAFLGAFYWTALAVALQSFGKRFWVEARVGVWGVLIFVTLTFLLTALHFDKFHFESENSSAKGAAYFWFAIYLIDPVFIAAAWLHQTTRPGTDLPRIVPIPKVYRTVLFGQGSLFTAIGLLLFCDPTLLADAWPWPLTALTAQAIGAWLIGLGVIELSAVWERSWERIDVLTVSYTVLGVLLGIALARYGNTLDWSEAGAWVYVAGLISILLMGIFGVLASRRMVAERL